MHDEDNVLKMENPLKHNVNKNTIFNNAMCVNRGVGTSPKVRGPMKLRSHLE